MKIAKQKHKLRLAGICSAVLAGVLALSSAVPLMKVFADSHGEGEYVLYVGMDDANGATFNLFKVNNYDWTTENDEYRSGDGTYIIDVNYTLAAEDVGFHSSLMTSGDFAPYFMELGGAGDGQGTFQYTYSFDYLHAINDGLVFNRLPLQVNVERGGPGPGPQGNIAAQVHVASDQGTYVGTCFDEETKTEVDNCDVPYLDQFSEFFFGMNGGPMTEAPWGQDLSQGYDVDYHYNADEQDEKAIFTLATRWHVMLDGQVYINGQPYDVDIDYGDQVDWLNHYEGQVVSFDVEVPRVAAVEGVEHYNIVVKTKRNPVMHIGNFLWTGDPEQQYEKQCDPENLDEHGNPICEIIYDEDGNPVPGRDYVGHSTLMLLEVSYTVGGIYYHYSTRDDNPICEWYPVDNEEAIESCNPYEDGCEIKYLEFQSHSDGMVDGSLVLPANATVTMQVIPDYGYQVMNVNMADLTTDDNGVGEFTFTVPGGAAYFVADVVEMEDVVNSGSTKITGGTINLGDEQTSLEHGSARLEVNDVELSDEDIAGFEGAAEGYEVKSYLDISLFNVVCKGAETCTGSDEDSWNEQVRDLNEPATITLQLEEGVDGNEVVIVHQKHDGTYEIIPTIYDPVANTLTFTTSSFSNYAIASRTASSPETGRMTNLEGVSASSDFAIGAVVAAAVSVIVIVGTTVVTLKKQRDNK